MNYIPNFRETFPELNKLTYEELCDRWRSLGINFYTEEKKESRTWIRLTLPLALIFLIFMFLSLPIVYMITGKWGYGHGKNNIIYNWFKELRLH